MIIHHQHAHGYTPRTEPDRYPTRASWPALGSVGYHVNDTKKQPVTLVLVHHQYYAVFRKGHINQILFNLQDFVICK